MTYEEWERRLASARAKLQDRLQSERNPEQAAAAQQKAAERRKLDRDMDRLERVLKRIVATPMPKRSLARNPLGIKYRKSHEKWLTEIRKIGARSDRKLQALREEIQKRQAKHHSS